MTAIRIALIALAAALAAALGWVSDWGRDFSAEPDVLRQKAAVKADAGTLLPDFKLSAESNAYAQISERPLLNPTRRPAPTQAIAQTAPEPPRPQIRRGLYQLVGVSDLGGVKVAQVKETATNRTKNVRVGDLLQELEVARIDQQSVTLSFLGETDVLSLAKFTPSGRLPVPAPAPPPQPVAGVSPPPPAAVDNAVPVAIPPALPPSIATANSGQPGSGVDPRRNRRAEIMNQPPIDATQPQARRPSFGPGPGANAPQPQ